MWKTIFSKLTHAAALTVFGYEIGQQTSSNIISYVPPASVIDEIKNNNNGSAKLLYIVIGLVVLLMLGLTTRFYKCPARRSITTRTETI